MFFFLVAPRLSIEAFEDSRKREAMALSLSLCFPILPQFRLFLLFAFHASRESVESELVRCGEEREQAEGARERELKRHLGKEAQRRSNQHRRKKAKEEKTNGRHHIHSLFAVA